ncbi:MAG TPA: transcription elongation factor GreA [Clostridiales bacterium]|nr:transcription elongation factor GreA [Clostridiales bacterium]HCW51942.1 transcription elongation factor GreA [Clostridiales bacterium]
MPEKEVILSAEGLRRLEEKLDYLRRVKRHEVAERIRKARQFGDINENSEYEDAKKEQSFIEGEILQLEKLLRNAKLIDDINVDPEVVGLWSRVKLQDLESQETFEYTIVSSTESDPDQNKISDESPVGRAVLGQRAGQVVEVQVPDGTLRYKILEVSR